MTTRIEYCCTTEPGRQPGLRNIEMVKPSKTSGCSHQPGVLCFVAPCWAAAPSRGVHRGRGQVPSGSRCGGTGMGRLNRKEPRPVVCAIAVTRPSAAKAVGRPAPKGAGEYVGGVRQGNLWPSLHRRPWGAPRQTAGVGRPMAPAPAAVWAVGPICKGPTIPQTPHQPRCG